MGNFLQQNGIGSLPDQILIPWVKGFKNFWRKGKVAVLSNANNFSLSHNSLLVTMDLILRNACRSFRGIHKE